MTHNDRFFHAILAGVVTLFCLLIPVVGFASFGVLKQVAPNATLVLPSTISIPAILPGSAATPAPMCSGPTSMDILLIGSDSRLDNYTVGLGDSIHVVRADFVRPSLMYLALDSGMIRMNAGLFPILRGFREFLRVIRLPIIQICARP
jgi:hypothetical protein